MGLYESHLHGTIASVHSIFNQYCINHGLPYKIISDEKELQSYLVEGTGAFDKICGFELLRYARDPNSLNTSIDVSEDGVIYTIYTDDSDADINEGHWQVKGSPYAMPGQSKKSKRSDYSPFVNKSDAKKVRSGGTPIQKLGNKEAQKASFEDQYKNPTGKHRRSQSMRPSSFAKSKTFGGVSDDMKNKPNVEPPNMRPLGVFGPGDKGAPQSSSRSSPGSGSLIQGYGERKPRSEGVPQKSVPIAPVGSPSTDVKKWLTHAKKTKAKNDRQFAPVGGRTRGESFSARLDAKIEEALNESYAEDDIYTSVQRIAIESGITAKPRKFRNPTKGEYAKVCNGQIAVEATPIHSTNRISVEVFKGDEQIHNSELDVRIGGPLRNEDEIRHIIDVVKANLES